MNLNIAIPSILCSLIFSPLTPVDSRITEKKLDDARTYFYLTRCDIAADYLSHWQFGDGSRLKPGGELLNNSIVYDHLYKQRSEIIAAVKRDLGNGNYKTNSVYKVVRESSLSRKYDISNFTYAIGGCYIASYAYVKIGAKNWVGGIPCEITSWSSTLSDEYKFDKSDSYSIGKIGFSKSELYEFERMGYAEDFQIKSGQFYFGSLKGKFTVY
jgi:hypothetical protein